MWCQVCRKEFDAQDNKCPECGSKLKQSVPDSKMAKWFLSFSDKQTDNWPYLEDGQPEKPAFLKHCTAVNMEDKMLVNLLSAYDIPVITLYPKDGTVGKILLGISGFGTDIYVPESLLEDARALMEETPDD